jgi:hypothetical protein
MKLLPVLFVFLLPFLFLGAGYADDAPKPAPTGPVLRMFTLKYADADQIGRLFSQFSYPISTNRDFNVLTVTAPASFLEKVEAIVKQFDVAPMPPKNIELTLYLLAGTDEPGSTPLPKEFDEIQKHLLETSSFKAYKLADSHVIRTRAGQPADSTGSLEISQIRFRAIWINADAKGNIISVDGLHVQIKASAIDVDLDLREGQLTVIGKISPGGLLLASTKVSE